MFYPIYVKNNQIIGIGKQPNDDFHPGGRNVTLDDDTIEIWPIDQNGIERRWNYAVDTIESHLDRIIILPKDGLLDLFITSELAPPKTVWATPELDAGGKYGSQLVSDIVGDKFPFPKSLYTVLYCIEPVIRKNPDAVVLDFFAGSGTTLNALNLINHMDKGKRMGILVTNNEVSIEDEKKLISENFKPGDEEWNQKGIARSITWKRTKNSILGKREDGTFIKGDYLTPKKELILKKRYIKHINFIDINSLNTISKRKNIVSILKVGNIPQHLVKKDSDYVISEEHQTTILFNDGVLDEWLNLISDNEKIINFYIVTSSNTIFKNAKEFIENSLGDYEAYKNSIKPISSGFPTNAIFFKLGFLNKDSIALGKQFKELLSLLWMKAGAIGKCPNLDDSELSEYLFFSKNKFAVLLNETHYANFKNDLNSRSEIETVFIVTNSEKGFSEMTLGLKVANSYQLYRDYLDNFRINVRRS